MGKLDRSFRQQPLPRQEFQIIVRHAFRQDRIGLKTLSAQQFQ